VSLQKFFKLFSSEDPAATSLVFFPISDILIRIIPQQVSDKARIRHISRLWDHLDLFEAMHVLGEATVHAHDLFINQRHQGHVVEASIECLPETYFVSSLNFVEEAINSCDGLRLVISTQHNNLAGVSDLQGEEQADDLTALLSSVDVVAHEQVFGLLGDDVVVLVLLVLITHFLEHVEQICVLAVDVSEYFHWSFKLDNWFLIFEDFLRFFDKELDHFVWEVDEWHTLWVLRPVSDNVVVKVVNDYVHDKRDLISQVLLWNLLQSFFELLSPLFLNVEGF